MARSFFLLRKLTGSELGWFAGPRRLGKAKGRQRGINFNASIMKRIFPPDILRSREIRVITKRISDGQTQERPLRRQEKNWRLVGDMVFGSGLEDLQEGDFFVAQINVDKSGPFEIEWDVIPERLNSKLHNRLSQDFSVFLEGGMASWDDADPVGLFLARSVGLRDATAEKEVQQTEPKNEGSRKAADESETRLAQSLTSKPMPLLPKASQKRKRLGDRLQRPNILTEIVKSGMALSAKAQADFIEVLDTLSSELRSLLLEAKLLKTIKVDHRRVWAEVKGVRIGFVDGGMANVASVGSAPLALRVGSYVVTPGEPGPDREQFDFEIILVDDLYESSPTRPGVYEDMFEDLAKLRDAARIAAEAGGLLSLMVRPRPPAILFLHGPLVNPVSPYALGVPGQQGAFPNYTRETLKKLLPDDENARTGREANFVSVYLEQLNRLKNGTRTVCGVVERPSSAAPGPLIRATLQKLHDDGLIDAATLDTFLTRMEGYHITDSLIFECVLDEGEYVEPVELDKQGPQHKIPVHWAPEIGAYPRPMTTYVKTNSETMPIRVESFKAGPLTHEQLMRLVVHMSRLLPHYAFPVGLDIVDKHAKVPEWMSKQMSAMLSAQLMRKAMESGNPATIRWVRRVLSANVRDWLFRPDFRGG